MTSIRSIATLALAGLLFAAVALAQSGAAGGQAQGSAGANGAAHAANQNAQVSSVVNASAEANAKLSTEEMRKQIDQRCTKVSAKAIAKAETQLDASAHNVDATVKAQGWDKVATRLAPEFGMTTEALATEKSQLDASWGNLAIANTLAANSKTGVSAAQLIELQKSGMGWGKIAAGLGYNLGSVMSAAQAESHVAAGAAKSDGHVALIHGEGARAGVGANAGLNAGVHGANAKAGANVGVGVGVKVPH